jgi:hypothetical protein
LFQQSATATSITCADQQLHYLDWVQKYFDLADVVFYGKVVYQKTPDPPAPAAPAAPPISKPPESASSMKELLELIQAGQAADAAQASRPTPRRLQTATFEVVRSWKGPEGPIIFANSLMSDQYNIAPFKLGDSYLIFGYKGDGDGICFVPTGCAVAQHAKDIASKRRVLDALTKKPGSS